MQKHRNLREHKAPESTQNNGETQNIRQHKAPESTQNNADTRES